MPKGGWIITYTGKHVYPFDFKPEMFDIRDVAHALANQCRFAGHVHQFYSVAEHCVHVSNFVEKRTPEEWENDAALLGLLHDAAETYIGDLAAPLKHDSAFSFFNDVERGIMQVILESYELPYNPVVEKQVEHTDREMLLAEGKHFFPLSIDSWGYPDKATTRVIEPPIACWSPHTAKRRFKERYNALIKARRKL